MCFDGHKTLLSVGMVVIVNDIISNKSEIERDGRKKKKPSDFLLQALL
jgi:hypothetical protein